jgi:PAS domain S-box-containing protein
MTRSLTRNAVFFFVLLMTAPADIAAESRPPLPPGLQTASLAQPLVQEGQMLGVFLAIGLLALIVFVVRTARRIAKEAVAANRELHQKIVELKRAGETLSRLAAIVECSDDAIIGKTLDGVIVSWNPSAERIYGYSEEEVIGQRVSLLVPPERPDEVTQILEKVKRGKRVDHVETVRRKKDGTRIDVSLSVSPIRDATGQVTGASTIARDISERKRAEEALRQSEERYRDLVEHSEMLICTHDPEGKILTVNRAMVRHLGYERAEDLLNRPLGDFLASDVVDLFDTYLDKVLKEGYAEGFMKVLTRSGEERVLEYRNSLRTEDPAKPIVRAIALDVTERMRAERELGKRTKRMQALRAMTLEITRELDTKTLLGLITRRAATLVGAVSGAVYLWDERAQVLHTEAVYSLGEWTRGKSLSLGEEMVGTVAQRRQGMMVHDYESSPYASSLVVERGRFNAAIAEPLLYHDRLVGVLTVNNEGTWQHFTEEDRDLLALFAGQAVIAIENARLYSDLSHSKRRLEELYSLGLAMQEHRTLQANLDLIMKGAQTVLGFDRMNILLANPEGTRLGAVASLGVDEPLEQIYVPVGPEGGGIVQAFVERKDIAWDGSGPVPEEWRLAPPYSEIKAFRSRCFVIVPLIVRGVAIGVLGADNKFSQKTIPAETIQLLKTFAAQAAIAIENARLDEELRGYARELDRRGQDRKKG